MIKSPLGKDNYGCLRFLDVNIFVVVNLLRSVGYIPTSKTFYLKHIKLVSLGCRYFGVLHDLVDKCIKGGLQGLRQSLITESPLKMVKNVFYFTLKALFVLKIFKFLS